MSLLDDITGIDLDVFMDVESGFARKITFQGTFGPYTVPVIFDNAEPVINDYTGEISNDAIRCMAKTSDLEDVKPHDTITDGLIVYEIIGINKGNSGLTVLTLNKIRED